MSVTIRLKRLGTKRKPHSRIVVCKTRSARDSRVIDTIGYYDPTKNPAALKIEKGKAEKWLKAGVQLSETVRSIFKREGLV